MKKTKKRKNPKSRFSKKINKIAAMLNKYRYLVLAVYIGFFLLSIFHIYYSRRIIPGVKIGSVDVGGKTFTQAKKALENFEKKSDKKVVFEYQNKLFEITSKEIDLSYDWDASVVRAFEVGRTGNPYTDNKEKLAGLFKKLFIAGFYDFDNELLNNKISEVIGEVSTPSHDAYLYFEGNQLRIKPSAKGTQVLDQKFFKDIAHTFDRFDYEKIKKLPVVVDEPKILERDISSVYMEVEKIVLNQLKVIHQDKTWNLDRDKMLSFLKIDKKDDVIQVEFNDPAFEAFLEELARDVNKLPRGQVTEVDGSQVIQFELVEIGSELNVKEFTDVFRKAYLEARSEVTLVMKEVSGPIEKEKYGIFALLGEGNSKFTGSANARIKNLTLAAERTNGVLVPPGEVYSFNSAVGEISGRTGYDSAWIIKGNKTVLGEGGGVCQTSTTMFRAILNSGLPVVMRFPHAYRVYYYELDMPVGFDASIYQPSLDLQFRNDTPNYVLVQSGADLASKTLTFKIYGTPDGREVEISEPVVKNQKAPPKAKYVDDPELPKGVTKQIDFAAWGADVTFNRVVKKNDEILYEDTFNSKFRPWQAVYLVGTKEN